MGDALCGPSNALQNFQKHASVDRTLQQDRLISRQSPSQGFRSQNSREGILDPEFAAFESNHAAPPIPDIQNPRAFVPSNPHFALPNHAESLDWAADFQRLRVSGPSQPISHHQNRPGAPLATMAQETWHAEFMQQQQQQRPLVHQQHQPYNHTFQSSFATGYPLHAPTNTFQTAQESGANNQIPTDTFDESAFDAAFEQARAAMEVQTANLEHENAEVVNKPSEANATELESHETIKIGSDTIPYVDKEDTTARPNDHDELAKTAGQLLDSVSHDQSQKFQQSNFLALMRRIRDREVHVQGDEFRETTQLLHPGGKYYPEGQRPNLNRHDTHVKATIPAEDISKFDSVQELPVLPSQYNTSTVDRSIT